MLAIYVTYKDVDTLQSEKNVVINERSLSLYKSL